MKNDLLDWLKETGRLPSVTMTEHLEELKQLNQLESQVKELKK
jgi:hypothetical protein